MLEKVASQGALTVDFALPSGHVGKCWTKFDRQKFFSCGLVKNRVDSAVYTFPSGAAVENLGSDSCSDW
jgi:hypothetical protein